MDTIQEPQEGVILSRLSATKIQASELSIPVYPPVEQNRTGP